MAPPQTPETMEGEVTVPEQPVQPEATPPTPEASPPLENEPTPMPTPETPAPETPTGDEVGPGIPAELAPQVQELINLAAREGVDKAIEAARKTGNASLVDALHAALRENKKDLEKLGKLKPAA